ncbi:MAG: MarR family transcriptional regulator [Lactobacillales bacterium]|jgi:DNA-binding MarR family transcriptional regulator|nr:MarR family transcriptional regulator [Lactobacillales bacterium]
MATLFETQQIIEKFMELSMLMQFSQDTKTRSGRNAFRGQGKVLLVLYQHENISQKELADYMRMTPQSTAEFVNKLVKRGMIEKSKSLTDGRVYLLRLTETGKKYVSDLELASPDGLKYIDEEEKQQLLSILTKLVDGMRADFEKREPEGVFDSLQNMIAQHVVKTHIPKKDEKTSSEAD